MMTATHTMQSPRPTPRAAEPLPSIFNSVEQALHVSFYVISLPPRQKCPLRDTLIQALESLGRLTPRQAMFLDYLYGEKGSIDFGGLTGNEVRAQCAMVVGTVRDHLAAGVRAAIWLRYARGIPARPKSANRAADPGIPPAPEWKASVVLLGKLLAADTGITNSAAMRALLAAHSFPAQRETEFSYAAISKETGVPVRTLERAAFKIRKRLRQWENEATDTLTPMYFRDGLIGEG